ncbi:MAG: HAMP domain-containing protein [Polyangiaceae bacterium]|nr:HAMP domain-containing protein [Polyangiaceae bacterium]
MTAAETPRDEPLEIVAEKALQQRPSFSIRARIMLGFLLLLLLSAGTAVGSWLLLSSIQSKMQLLVLIDRIAIEVQQARRFEKNYFLYGTNLADAVEHARNAHELLSARLEEGGSDPVLSTKSLVFLSSQLDSYEETLTALASAQHGAKAPPGAGGRSELAARLRKQGARTTSSVLKLAASERSFVEARLAFAKEVPLIFLAAMLGLSVLVASFLVRQTVGPLGRLVHATQRIAGGDLSPIMPARRYRDEFTELSLGINHMIHELDRRYQIIVESQKLRAVGTLTAGIAHELNNPLNNILLTTTTLRQFYPKLDDAERSEMLEDLVSQAERSQGIVRNLLDFTRQSGTHMEPLDLPSLIRDVTALAANQIKFHGCTVQVDLPASLPPVHGDRDLLSQVFLNLFLNALDAMDKGGRIHVSGSGIREPGHVVVDVTDSGCGIPEHLLDAVFDPFFTTKPTGAGTGLGLSVSRGIVRKHGGDIRASSKPGIGTTMSVMLPTTSVQAAFGNAS